MLADRMASVGTLANPFVNDADTAYTVPQRECYLRK